MEQTKALNALEVRSLCPSLATTSIVILTHPSPSWLLPNQPRLLARQPTS